VRLYTLDQRRQRRSLVILEGTSPQSVQDSGKKR
jgi:hypothetical protein